MEIDVNLVISLVMLVLQALQIFFAGSTWYITVYRNERHDK